MEIEPVAEAVSPAVAPAAPIIDNGFGPPPESTVILLAEKPVEGLNERCGELNNRSPPPRTLTTPPAGVIDAFASVARNLTVPFAPGLKVYALLMVRMLLPPNDTVIVGLPPPVVDIAASGMPASDMVPML